MCGCGRDLAAVLSDLDGQSATLPGKPLARSQMTIFLRNSIGRAHPAAMLAWLATLVAGTCRRMVS